MPGSLHLSMHIWRRAWRILTAALILISILAPSPSLAQGETPTDPEVKAQALLEQLTPQERVGQLFLVTFQGNSADEGTAINDLIRQHFIGGVVLLAQNDNFMGEDTLRQIYSLNQEIQNARWNAAQSSQTDPVTGDSFQPSFVPLFIGLSQEGSGPPYDQLLKGMTPLPNPMALGATWNPELSQQAGSVLGQEMKALGFNLLLGPSLDVLESPKMESSKDMGVRAFGGDPFWVAEMSSAFISGVHSGSEGQVSVVAKHFPGHGAADRLPEEEVATIRRSLEQLRNFDLVPFFGVTGGATDPLSVTDGLLVSHVRYQGFQGNIRDTTRPVSLDPQAFLQLIDLPAIAAWRESGGVMVSDDLGSQAIGNYYKLNSQEFDPRRVAFNAFRAGNDLLYIDLSNVTDLTGNAELDPHTATIQTIEYFVQRYREDSIFAQLVDASVLRILTWKFRVYDEFNLDTVLSSSEALENVGQSGQITFEIARQAATLISPSLTELTEIIPDPPNQNDRLVFITDSLVAQQCSTCPPQAVFDERAMQQVVLRRYGQQVNINNLVSYPLSALETILSQPPGSNDLENDLIRAHWIIFSMVGGNERPQSYNTLRTFLLERPDLFQGKRVIVFAFSAPYFLDATNISKLTAYYGLYSYAPQFVDVAAYLLFRDFSPTGALPVSISGVYDLNTALFPDPAQTIPLTVDVPGEPVTDTVNTPEPFYQLGELIPVRTGKILDHNGHAVPDGTPVTFVLTVAGEAISTRQTERTLDGIARTTFQFVSPGLIEVRVETETAKSSEVLRFEVQQPPSNGAVFTSTPEPTATSVPPTPTPTLQPLVTQEPPVTPDPPSPGLAEWLVALLVIASVAAAAFRFMFLAGQIRWGLRGAFLAVCGGLLAYSYLAFRLPGSKALMDDSVMLGVFLMALGGALLGVFLTWLWNFSENGRRL